MDALCEQMWDSGQAGTQSWAERTEEQRAAYRRRMQKAVMHADDVAEAEDRFERGFGWGMVSAAAMVFGSAVVIGLMGDEVNPGLAFGPLLIGGFYVWSSHRG